PVFDPNGKYLYFDASTDAGPAQDWFSMWNDTARATNSLYLVVLAKGVASPLAKESDEEAAKKADEAKDEKKDNKEPVKVTVDTDGLSQRIVAIPLPGA